MMRKIKCWFAVFVIASVALAQGAKDRVSAPPPKSDLVGDFPSVDDPAIAFPLLVRQAVWAADRPLQIVGGRESFVLLERLYDADAVQTPDKTLARLFGEKGPADFSVPVLRKAEQPLTLFFSQVKPFPDRNDNFYILSGASGEDILVLAYRSVRGRNHITTGDSRLEVIDFGAKVAMAFSGAWCGIEKAVGIERWPAEKQDVDDVRIVRVELDDQLRAKSTESLIVRRLFMRHYLAGDTSDKAKNHGTESQLSLYCYDTSGPDGLRFFAHWADARAASSKAMRDDLAAYGKLLSGGSRMPQVFAEAVLAREFAEDPRAQNPVGGPVNPSRIDDEGALVAIPWLRHSTNHSPTFGVAAPGANFERWRKVCAAAACEKAALPILLFDPRTSTSELGDIAVELGAGCKLKNAYMRSASGWLSLLGREDLEAVVAAALKLEQLTPEGRTLLHALLVAGAESPPDKKGDITNTPPRASKRKR